MSCQQACVLNSLQFRLQNSTPQRPPTNRLKIYAQGGAFFVIDAAGNVDPFGEGSVTSVAATTSDPNLSILGSPITSAGNFVFALQGITAFVRTIFDDANAAAVRTTLGLVIGTNVQAHSATLDLLVSNSSWTGVTDWNLAANLNVTGDTVVMGILNANGGANVVTPLTLDSGPTITTGAGAPASAEPDGSIYLRSGAPNGKLYVRENGVWQVK